MGKGLEKLLSIAISPLRFSIAGIPRLLAEKGVRGQEVYSMLTKKNGFFVFESALHILPIGLGRGMDLETWNSPSLWRLEYGDMADNLLFFAEDAFGFQFAIRDESVVCFDPETGRTAEFASTLEGWADLILSDYEVLTGFPLIHDWQERHGSIPADRRLAPRIPFVLGGEYSLANLYLADPVELMRFRASIARQIRDLPDGAPIKLKIT